MDGVQVSKSIGSCPLLFNTLNHMEVMALADSGQEVVLYQLRRADNLGFPIASRYSLARSVCLFLVFE